MLEKWICIHKLRKNLLKKTCFKNKEKYKFQVLFLREFMNLYQALDKNKLLCSSLTDTVSVSIYPVKVEIESLIVRNIYSKIWYSHKDIEFKPNHMKKISIHFICTSFKTFRTMYFQSNLCFNLNFNALLNIL